MEFQKALIQREVTYDRLAKSMGKRGYRISKQFIGMLALGQRRVPAQQLKRMCEVLELDEVGRSACTRRRVWIWGLRSGASMADDAVFYPTVAFGFSKVQGKDLLHQMWISNMGDIDWRPVPLVELRQGGDGVRARGGRHHSALGQ